MRIIFSLIESWFIIMLFGTFVLARLRTKEKETLFGKCWRITMIVFCILLVVSIILRLFNL